jgi:hypothetical protein
MTITTALPTIQFVLSPFPEPGEPIWDEICLEWQLIDADGFCYWGETPSACERQYHEAMYYLAEHARKSGFSIAELRAFRAQDRDRADQLMNERPY